MGSYDRPFISRLVQRIPPTLTHIWNHALQRDAHFPPWTGGRVRQTLPRVGNPVTQPGAATGASFRTMRGAGGHVRRSTRKDESRRRRGDRLGMQRSLRAQRSPEPSSIAAGHLAERNRRFMHPTILQSHGNLQAGRLPARSVRIMLAVRLEGDPQCPNSSAI